MTTDQVVRFPWRYGAALWALAFAASTVAGTHGIAYWDSGDYVLLAITGGQSGLLLGRPVFLWISHGVLSLGVDPGNAEPVLRWFWSATGAIAAPAMAVLAARLGLDRRSAIAAGAAMALSPSFAHTSHQVLTDAPALALSIMAIACAASRRVWLAGVILAAAVATRETAVVHLGSLMLLAGRRDALKSLSAFLVSVAVIVAISRPPGMAQWFASMSQSMAAHRWSPRDLLTSFAWIVACGPLPVLLGALALLRGSLSASVRVVAVPAAIATVLLAFYPDGAFSPRYVLAAAPLAFFLAAAPSLAVRPAASSIALLLGLAIGVLGAQPADAVARQGATLTSRLPQLPSGSVVVPGHFCPQARLAAAITDRVDFQFVCPGWDWPTDVAASLDGSLLENRPIAVDLADEAWVGPREIGPREAVRAWAERHEGQSLAGFKVIHR